MHVRKMVNIDAEEWGKRKLVCHNAHMHSGDVVNLFLAAYNVSIQSIDSSSNRTRWDGWHTHCGDTHAVDNGYINA